MATTDALVQTINVPVYGRDAKFPAGDISEVSFGKWAAHVKQLLLAHSTLAKTKLIPRDSITDAAKNALWNTFPALADIPRDYDNPAIATAATAANVAARVEWNNDWLVKITHACAPDTAVAVLSAIRKIRFGTDSTTGST